MASPSAPAEDDDELWYLMVTAKPGVLPLTIELVPKTCWGTNLKEELSRSVADASSLLANANANARVNVVC